MSRVLASAAVLAACAWGPLPPTAPPVCMGAGVSPASNVTIAPGQSFVVVGGSAPLDVRYASDGARLDALGCPVAVSDAGAWWAACDVPGTYLVTAGGALATAYVLDSTLPFPRSGVPAVVERSGGASPPPSAVHRALASVQIAVNRTTPVSTVATLADRSVVRFSTVEFGLAATALSTNTQTGVLATILRAAQPNATVLNYRDANSLPGVVSVFLPEGASLPLGDDGRTQGIKGTDARWTAPFPATLVTLAPSDGGVTEAAVLVEAHRVSLLLKEALVGMHVVYADVPSAPDAIASVVSDIAYIAPLLSVLFSSITTVALLTNCYCTYSRGRQPPKPAQEKSEKGEALGERLHAEEETAKRAEETQHAAAADAPGLRLRLFT